MSLDESRHSSLSEPSRRSSASDRSGHSYRTQSTVPTEYEYITQKLDNLRTHHLYPEYQQKIPTATYADSPRSSAETYASTVPSIQEEDPLTDSRSDFEIPAFHPDAYYDDTIPTTPSDFSKLFPSTRKLSISHDDSTPDGNMNLKVKTEVRSPRGRVQNMTLFHLRMYDLKSREFSLRRYDRDSGREVCHSTRNYQKTEVKRPGLQRSFTNAIASLRSRSDNRMHTLSTMSRAQSQNRSKGSIEAVASERPRSAGHDTRSQPRLPTNSTQIEFSNYAHVEVRRRGASSDKRYKFEYWGKKYYWKRHVQKNGKDISTSFYLFQKGGSDPLANIVPEPLSPTQRSEERGKGGWVPPCAMWISDEQLIHMQNDMSDVIIASGLVALVDDCIKRRFHGKPRRHGTAHMQQKFKSPTVEQPSSQGRHLVAAGHGPTSSHHPTPLRYAH